MSVIKAIATVTAQSNPKSLTDGTALEAIIKKPLQINLQGFL